MGTRKCAGSDYYGINPLQIKDGESASVFEGHRSCFKLKIIFQARHGFICDQRATVSGDLKTVLAAY